VRQPDWFDISAQCTQCGSVGCVDTQRDLGEVNFNKGIS
jgi:hypothetical protein